MKNKLRKVFTKKYTTSKEFNSLNIQKDPTNYHFTSPNFLEIVVKRQEQEEISREMQYKELVIRRKK